ncbi:hypothetical protein Glaag_0907 [Glaciecola sp. 4H-3-7+YE-5]|nr:hypothetical protein Glaag_0907 [Glaciecola sp. 4H-3-7+YE-5]
MKRRSGFYIGFAVGFMGNMVQKSSGNTIIDLSPTELLFESFVFALFSGGLLLLGVSALAGRGNADNVNSQKYDGEIRGKLNKEVASDVVKRK